jgi:hypothetical protein
VAAGRVRCTGFDAMHARRAGLSCSSRGSQVPYGGAVCWQLGKSCCGQRYVHAGSLPACTGGVHLAWLGLLARQPDGCYGGGCAGQWHGLSVAKPGQPAAGKQAPPGAGLLPDPCCYYWQRTASWLRVPHPKCNVMAAHFAYEGRGCKNGPSQTGWANSESTILTHHNSEWITSCLS